MQHSLRLGPRHPEAAVRALLLRGGEVRQQEVAVQRAVVDPLNARALWDANSLSAAETYGGAGDWRWRLRSSGGSLDQEPSLDVPPLVGALSDVWLSAPSARLTLEGEVDLGGGWRPFAGPASLVHRACLGGCGPWAWLALPGLGLVAAQTRLPALPVRVATGRQDAVWPLRLGEPLRQGAEGWRLRLPDGRDLTLLERGRVSVARGLSGTVSLAFVEVQDRGEGSWGVLESFTPDP